MCKYCDNVFDGDKDLSALWFKRKGPIFKNTIDMWQNKNKKQLGVIINLKSDCKHSDKGPVLSIKGRNKRNDWDWLDLNINYCPICGKQLRKQIIAEEKING